MLAAMDLFELLGPLGLAAAPRPAGAMLFVLLLVGTEMKARLDKRARRARRRRQGRP
ncbi:MAG: hypothetical protein AAFR52_18610 [Pseudomonadota bacterium]